MVGEGAEGVVSVEQQRMPRPNCAPGGFREIVALETVATLLTVSTS